MKKLTKKQHRGIIGKLIARNNNIEDLRAIQQVVEFFKEDAEVRKEGDVLRDADAVRMLLDLINAGCGADAYSTLYGLWEEQEKDIIDDNNTKAMEILRSVLKIQGDENEELIEGVDFFKVRCSEVRPFFGQTLPNGFNPNAEITLITETGYLMLVKSFTDDFGINLDERG